MPHFIITYHISLVNVQTNYSNNNLLIFDVKQLNEIMKFYYLCTLKVLWDSQGKSKMYYGMSRVKKQLLRKRSIASCLPVTLLKVNGYGVSATTIITESKTNLILLLFKQRGVAQVVTVIAVETWRWYDFDMISLHYMVTVWMSYRHHMFMENSTDKAALKINNSVSSPQQWQLFRKFSKRINE